MAHGVRRAAGVVWLAVLAAGLYVYLFRHDWLRAELSSLSGAPVLWVAALYMMLGCRRALTWVPATYLRFAGMMVLPPGLLFSLTLAGIIVSSAAVYRFAGAMGLAAFFERRHAPQVARLRQLLQR